MLCSVKLSIVGLGKVTLNQVMIIRVRLRNSNLVDDGGGGRQVQLLVPLFTGVKQTENNKKKFIDCSFSRNPCTYLRINSNF